MNRHSWIALGLFLALWVILIFLPLTPVWMVVLLAFVTGGLNVWAVLEHLGLLRPEGRKFMRTDARPRRICVGCHAAHEPLDRRL